MLSSYYLVHLVVRADVGVLVCVYFILFNQLKVPIKGQYLTVSLSRLARLVDVIFQILSPFTLRFTMRLNYHVFVCNNYI